MLQKKSSSLNGSESAFGKVLLAGVYRGPSMWEKPVGAENIFTISAFI